MSSVEIERICNAVDSNVLETAAIGVPPSGGGPEQLVIAVVFKDPDNMKADLDQLKKSFNSAVQKNLNPLFRVFLLAHPLHPPTQFPFLCKTWGKFQTDPNLYCQFVGFSGCSFLISSKDSDKQGYEKGFATAACSS